MSRKELLLKTGSDKEYNRCHAALRKKYGPASRCENKECKSKNPNGFHWALKHGHSYTDNRKDYIQLCHSCHKKYDLTEEFKQKMALSRLGKPCRSEVRPIRATDASGNIHDFPSIMNAANVLGVTRGNINHCLAKRRNFAGGLKWEYI